MGSAVFPAAWPPVPGLPVPGCTVPALSSRESDALIARPTIAEPTYKCSADAAPGQSHANLSPRTFTAQLARWLPLIVLAALAAGGCRGAAYRDVYQQKMASEIRVLEDQLYEADYHNQVLTDELERLKSQIAVPAERRSRPVEEPRRSSERSVTDPPARRSEPAAPQLPARPIPDPVDPPLVPIPPGTEELDFPDVDLGEPLPPGDPAAPPGQIQLPDSVRKLYREEPAEPTSVRINPGLSGGHRFDDAEEKTGMYLAVEVVDEAGKLVSLDNLDRYGELNVAIVDPQREPADAQLGQWNFAGSELRALVRSGTSGPVPGDRIDVHVAWNEKLPLGTNVVAHVRLTVDETQLQAQAELPTADAVMARWNPRAGNPTR